MTLADLPDYVPDTLRKAARQQSIGRRQCLYNQGDDAHAIFFVRTGELEAVRFSPEGDPLVMLRAGVGEFFAEPALGADRYGCSARAMRDSEVYVLPKASVLAALREDRDFSIAFLNAQIRNLRRQCSRYERARLRRAEDRVLHFLVTETGPDGWIRLTGPLADWAVELGLTPESLYRAMSRLRQQARIEERDGALRIVR